jgi:hypothetical protein
VNSVYKVAYDPESFRVDTDETERLRDAERQARLERGSRWDEFQSKWSELQPSEEILQWFGSWPDGEPVAPVFRM